MYSLGTKVTHRGVVLLKERNKLIKCKAVNTDSQTIQKPNQTIYKEVRLRTLSDCQLAVAVYPMFGYNAEGGGGVGRAVIDEESETGTRYNLQWDPEEVFIPDLTYQTTTFLGIPLPPPLKIAIVPNKLEGWWDQESGEAQLYFSSKFNFSIGPLYQAPSLDVDVTLTTERADGQLRQGKGQRLRNGKGRLVGIATVPLTGDYLLDKFLMLPNDAFALLSSEIEIV
eukprot:TRINITY_DN3406_c0_g1_i6.p1 TRINITY_DN3406_c0_g1~~TRINITY_DN3406_c0_g1_i6.p1  ORF type:complete len:246 (+),score=16.53 TRINITY_DN3406_c0_g1_i6:63-740(+)